jgi:hypothetical protein
MDRYTRIVLTLIAVGIWGILLMNLADSGRGPIGVANAQVQAAPTKVIIVGVQSGDVLNVVDVYARSTNSAASRQSSASQSSSPAMQPPPPH